MHSHGVVHQDIRPVNVAFRNGKPLFIDFAFASLLDWSPLNTDSISRRYSPSGYFGTRETASDRILAILAEDPEADVEVIPKDDLISLYKVRYITILSSDIYFGCKTWQEFHDAWHDDSEVRRLTSKSYEELVGYLTDDFVNGNGGTACWQPRRY